MEQRYLDMLAGILDCTYAEVKMLAKTEIDVGEICRSIIENEYEMTISRIYYEAFKHELYWRFEDLPEYNDDDFEVFYNGTQDTHIYVKGSKAEYYRTNASADMEAMEDVFNMDWEETVE